MCGRFFLTSSRYELDALFEVSPDHDSVDPLWFKARYNLPPSEMIPGATVGEDLERRLDLYRWGLVPNWVKDLSSFHATTINARAESVSSKPLYRSAYRHRRVLVPASGFFEWDRRNPKAKQPYAFVRNDGLPVVFAGLWEAFRSPSGDWMRSCAILTAASNEDMPIHDRIPVVLEREVWDRWLDPSLDDPEELHSIVGGRSAGVLRHFAVGRRVGSVRFDEPSCIEPIELIEPQRLL